MIRSSRSGGVALNRRLMAATPFGVEYLLRRPAVWGALGGGAKRDVRLADRQLG